MFVLFGQQRSSPPGTELPHLYSPKENQTFIVFTLWISHFSQGFTLTRAVESQSDAQLKLFFAPTFKTLIHEEVMR